MLLLELSLFLAPFLCLALALALGRYPGERVLRSLASSGRRILRPAPGKPPHSRDEVRPRGALLIARALAERAPPAVIDPA